MNKIKLLFFLALVIISSKGFNFNNKIIITK